MARPEKRDLTISFVPIVCSAPLIYAHSQGMFARRGLNVSLRAAPGWSGIKELMAWDKVDAVHMLSPMPLACSLGLDGRQADIRLAAIQNVNGQALTLASRHLGIRSVRDMVGFTFGVPYRFSMHYYLLCLYLAQNGVDPLREVTIKEVSPPRMPYYLAKGWVDGVFAPEPFNQIPVLRGTGFIHTLSREIWDGHPCCGFATRRDFAEKSPVAYRTMLEAVLEAELTLHRASTEQKLEIARQISGPGHLNQEDPTPVEQVLSGRFPDGTGRTRDVPDRIDFRPVPWLEYGSWMLSQMQRWAQLPGQVDYREVVESVFATAGTRELAEAMGFDDEGPRLGGVAPFTGEDPYAYACSQPFADLKDEAEPREPYKMPKRTRERLAGIVEHLADVAGGSTELGLAVTSADELGWLEQILNEMVLNLRFSKEALAEHNEQLELRVAERTAALEEEIEERRRAEDVVARQAQEILELSTPVMSVAKGVLVAPLIGAPDDRRAEQFAERLLQAIVSTSAEVVLLDITGVPILDTHTAQHLIDTLRAVRLLGCRAVVTGVRPTIAQTLVHLGIDLSEVSTRSSLMAGLELALAWQEAESA